MTPENIAQLLGDHKELDPIGKSIWNWLHSHFEEKNSLIDTWVKTVLPEEFNPSSLDYYEVSSAWLKKHGYRVVMSDDGWMVCFMCADEMIAQKVFTIPDAIVKLLQVRYADVRVEN